MQVQQQKLHHKKEMWVVCVWTCRPGSGIAGKMRRRAGRAAADTPGKGTVSQGTAGPVRRRQNSHNPNQCLPPGQRARPQGAAGSNTTHLPSTTPTGSGLLSHPWATYIPLSLSLSPCPSSTVTWATQVNAWLYLMDAVSHGDSDVRRARSPSPLSLVESGTRVVILCW